MTRLSNGPEMAQDDLRGVNTRAGGLRRFCTGVPLFCTAFLFVMASRVLPAGRVSGGLAVKGGSYAR
jgi:hypothetical protein